MVISARTIGGAGTGKTRELMGIIEQLVEREIHPLDIGFCSFTRAARREAAERAGDQHNIKPAVLEQDGWFRTLHSVCYTLLGVSKGSLLSGDRESAEWLSEVFGERVAVSGSLDDEANDAAIYAPSKSDSEIAMQLWSVARNRLVGLRVVHERAAQSDPAVPPLAICEKAIAKYEQAKRLDGRLDFTDLLTRFAGWSCLADGIEETTPEGYPPDNIVAWILDEAQDITPLSGAVLKRLVYEGERTNWCYLSGDPFQSIYTFAGADPRVFMAWEVKKQRIAKKTWRCPQPILDLGESILRDCSDYFDRGIGPADHEGEVVRAWDSEALNMIDPSESWLTLARSHYQSKRLGARLTERAIPWAATRGLGGWDRPARNAVAKTLLAMEGGHPVPPDEFAHAIKRLPAKLFVRGTKTRWGEMSKGQLDSSPFVCPDGETFSNHTPTSWTEAGITEETAGLIRTGEWRRAGIVDDAERFCRAIEKHGYEVVDNPNVRVGTIHSSKGTEADNVAVLATSTQRIADELEREPASADAERRVWYVGVTRARRRLVVVRSLEDQDRRRPEFVI